MTSARIDLDAARAARREAAGENPVVAVNGREFVLPVEVPFEAATQMGELAKAVQEKREEALGEGFVAVVRALLGEDYDEFMRTRPSVQDLVALVDGVVKAYGFADPGESPASASSS